MLVMMMLAVLILIMKSLEKNKGTTYNLRNVIVSLTSRCRVIRVCGIGVYT